MKDIFCWQSYKSMFVSFVYFEIRKKKIITGIFSTVCGAEVDSNTVVFKFTYLAKTVIIYLCFMHQYVNKKGHGGTRI